MEFLLELLLEGFLQVAFELLFELGIRARQKLVAPPASPWLAAIGYALLGAAAGGISLLPFPSLLLETPAARLAHLILVPIAAGAAMAAIGSWRRRKGQRLIRLDRFIYGYLFALSMAVVRLLFCE